jgi:hypothetical protein
MKTPNFNNPESYTIRYLRDQRDLYRLITTIVSIMLFVSIAYNIYLERKIDKIEPAKEKSCIYGEAKYSPDFPPETL